MHLKSFAALVAAVLLCVSTGCHLCGTHGGCGGSACDAGPIGCDSCGGGCTDGSCGGLIGLLGGRWNGCSGCSGGCASCATPESINGDGYGVRGGYQGPFADHLGQYHRGPQSHMGPLGPADGPASPTVTYPYYTTRGPRDFFAANPPSIGP